MTRTLKISTVLSLLLAGSILGAEPRREIRFPDVSEHRTLKCDFHMHTVFSDGSVWPTIRVEEAWREGLDAICISDHLEYRPHKQDLPGGDFNRPYEIARGLAAERNILLVRGAEVTRETPPGHFNAIFVRDVNPLAVDDFHKVFEAAAEQQAYVFWNHPGWQGVERGRWGEAQTRLLERKQMHGIEICNGDEYYADAHREAIERNLAMFGNSDMHAPFPTTPWTPGQHRTLTLVFAKEKTLDALREAVFAGRTAAWFENQVIGREALLAPLFEACVQIRPAHHRGKGTVFVEIENRSELDITLERDGGRSIKLPAGRISAVQLDAAATQPAGITWKATNFLVAPGRTLDVTLRVPER